MSSIKYKGQTYSGASSIEDASHVIATDASGNTTTVQALLDAGAGIVELTQAQYDALPTATKNDGRIYAITDGTTTAIAEDVRYDNTDSGLTASNVQDAVDEITTTVSENFDDIFGDFASIETSSTASKAYAVGDYLVYDSKFYKVTAAIAQGDTIIPNTNVEQTTVADEFSNASNIDYNNTTSGLTATNVQDAVDEVSNAEGVSYDNTESGLTATNVQDAVDELESKHDLQYFSGSNEKCSWWGYKQGRLVFLRVSGSLDSTSYTKDAWTSLFTLDSAYRPVEMLNIVAVNNIYGSGADPRGMIDIVRIETSGLVKIWPYVDYSVPMLYATYITSS